MTPTNWTGLVALCAVLGIVGGIWWFGVYGGRMTNALEGLSETVKELRGDFKKATERTSGDITELKERTSKLESLLDVDGRISNVLDLRRRRGGNEA